MRTTIDLDASLLVRAKQQAAQEGRTLKSLIEEALRSRLARHPAADEDQPLPVYRPARPGLRPGVDLLDNEAMRDVLDDE